MATAVLNTGDLARLKSNHDFANGVLLRVADLTEHAGKKYRCTFTDGASTMRGVLASQFAELVASGELSNGCIVRVNTHVLNCVGNDEILLATDLTVVAPAPVGSQPMDTDTALTPHNTTPEAASKPQPGKENNTPGMLSPPTEYKYGKTPGASIPSLSPVSFMSPAPTSTPPTAGPKTQPTPSGSLAVSDRKNCHKIAQIHPYDSNWCIRAKLDRKGPLRTQSIRGSDIKILAVDLVDETGQQIQGTFWRAPAERFAEALVEGRIYVWHRFKVKPADKKYSSFKADYQLDFTDSTEVSEAADQGEAAAMTAAVEITPIDQLPRRVGGRAAVDVLGVVVALGPVGTVKRKADASELARRDVTLGDQSGKSVVVTLWGDNSTAQLDGQEGVAVLQVTQARVTDFNGCSVSTLTKSIVTINPAGCAASEAMRLWYATAGMSPDRFTPVGQDMAGARGASAGGAGGASRERYNSLKDVAAITPESIPDEKATFTAVAASVAMVNTEGMMYYLANPENGRKVVDQGGGRFWSEVDAKVVERPEHRYVLSIKVADHTGETLVQLFNKEAEAVMGMKADDLAALKEAGGEGFAAAVRAAAWTPWSVVLMTKAREYQGNKSVRHTAHRLDPMDWVTEGMRLAGLVGKYGI